MSSTEEISGAENKSSKQQEFKIEEVHSANNWEKANLGDTSRNEKFLRLMGAAKKEHHGRFVIGDQDSKHKRDLEEPKHVEEELEEQYQHSMEHRLVGGRKGHVGLGFHDEEEGVKKEGDEEKEVDNDGDAKDDKLEEKKSDVTEGKDGGSGDRKRESVDPSGPEHEEVKKIKFVKSDS